MRRLFQVSPAHLENSTKINTLLSIFPMLRALQALLSFSSPRRGTPSTGSPSPRAAAGDVCIVFNQSARRLSCADLATGETLTSISLQGNPREIVLSFDAKVLSVIWLLHASILNHDDKQALVVTGINSASCVIDPNKLAVIGPLGDGNVWSAAFSGDNQYVAIGGHENGAVALMKYDPKRRGSSVGPAVAHYKAVGDVNSLAFSPSSDKLLVGSQDHAVAVLTAPKLELIMIFTGHASGIMSCMFISDAIAVTGGWDHVAHVWNVETGESLKKLTFESNVVRGFALSPDESTFAVCSGNRFVYVYETENYALIASLLQQGRSVRCVSYADDDTILAGSDYGPVHASSIKTQQTLSTHPALYDVAGVVILRESCKQSHDTVVI